MSSRYHQFQNEATSTRTSTPRPPTRTSTSSDSSSSSSSSGSSSYSSSYFDPAATRYSMDTSQARVEVMRCSRCAKCVETVISARSGSELRRVSTDDAQASGMVRFGHNLYYCDRCARMVGYK